MAAVYCTRSNKLRSHDCTHCTAKPAVSSVVMARVHKLCQHAKNIGKAPTTRSAAHSSCVTSMCLFSQFQEAR